MPKFPTFLKRKSVRITLLSVFIISLYPLFVLGYAWTHVLTSDLEGGRHGPLDAYRHALASAVVAYTLDEKAVYLVSGLFESGSKDTSRMDKHNNWIGAQIGNQAASFSELEPTVRQHVLAGMENSPNANQITWLAKSRWGEKRLW